jgi:two-component system LytT family response regulator
VVHANGAQPLAAMRMNALETQLDPVMFLRIHRSHIVNLKAVSSITPDATGRFLVTLNDGTKLYASRSRSRDLRRRAV